MIGIASSAVAVEAAVRAAAEPINALRLNSFRSVIQMNSCFSSLSDFARDHRLGAPTRQQLLDRVRSRSLALHSPVRPVLGGLARPRFPVAFLMVREVERRL